MTDNASGNRVAASRLGFQNTLGRRLRLTALLSMRLTIIADIPDRWVPTFLGFLDRLRYCGSVGMSRNTTIYADGDGDFQPKFDITSDCELPTPSEPSEDIRGNQVFDAG